MCRYNATVLAYGQTGSGKTYTMGSGFEIDIPLGQVGIIPRAIKKIFDCINDIVSPTLQGYKPPEFKIATQFIELYNEEIIDLYNPIFNKVYTT